MKFFTKTISYTLLTFCFFILPAIINAGVIPQPPNNLGLVGYWSFEGTQDTSADDYSGNGNTGTMTNMDTGTDYVSGYETGSTALDFDGTDDFVNIPNDSALQQNDAITISAWVNSDDLSVQNTIIQKGTGETLATIKDEYRVQINSSGKVLFVYGNASVDVSALRIFTLDDATLTTAQWYHVALTYDYPTLTSIKIYINGTQYTSSNGTWTDGTGAGTTDVGVNTSTDPVRIGTRYYQTEYQFFNGKIDDVRIYSRALSASEISLLYSSKKATYQSIDKSNLIGYWSFEDATGTSATDFSGNGNVGTLTNMTNADWVNGRVGTALDFDGVNDYVSLGDIVDLNGGDKTIAFWANGTGTVLSHMSYGDATYGYKGWRIIHSSSLVYLEAQSASYGDQTDLRIAQTFSGWNHYVYVIDSDSNSDFKNNSKIYINGIDTAFVAVDEYDSGFQGNTDSPFDLLIGAFGDITNGFASYFDGQIDEVRIYNTALTATQIQNLYTNSKYTQVNTPQNNKLTDGLVGYWTFNGPDMTSTTALDVSGNGNNGMLANGPTTAIGKVGQAMSFDGVNDYVRVPDDTVLNWGAGEGSVGAWVKADGVPSSEFQRIVINGGYTEGGKRYELRLDENELVSFNIDDDSASVTNVSTTNLVSGEWYYVIGVRDASDCYLYINAVLEDTDDCSSVGNIDQAQDLLIGKGQDETGDLAYTDDYFDGSIDEVRVYNRALTTTEITRLYNMGK